jgi:hypothetical protein
LLAVLRQPVVREGQWQLLECAPAWDGNWTWDSFVAFAWEGSDEQRLIVAVNYSDHRSQCYLKLPFADLAAANWELTDQLGEVLYERDGNDLQARGLFLDEPAWSASIFSLTRSAQGERSDVESVQHAMIAGAGTSSGLPRK